MNSRRGDCVYKREGFKIFEKVEIFSTGATGIVGFNVVGAGLDFDYTYSSLVDALRAIRQSMPCD